MEIPTLRAWNKLGAQEIIALVLFHEIQMRRLGRALVSPLGIYIIMVHMAHRKAAPTPEYLSLSLSQIDAQGMLGVCCPGILRL